MLDLEEGENLACHLRVTGLQYVFNSPTCFDHSIHDDTVRKAGKIVSISPFPYSS